jgi:predicted AAA+ superfamily ATPase
MEILTRFCNISSQSILLLGPRGTGKSTFVKRHFPQALYLDLLLPDQFRGFLARPERLKEIILGNPDKKIIIIDEVQKVPELLDVVHSLLEEKRGWQFILTGSSARKLKKKGTDLLAGRAIRKFMHPFLAAELNEKFDLNFALKFGLLPVVWDSQDPKGTLDTYVDVYLKEEVQMEGLTRNIGNFSRFLEIASFSHASILNISNLSRECQIERKVAEGYIHILEDLLIAYRIPAFSKRAQRETITHPKFYFFDAGVFRTLRPNGPLDRPSEIEGAGLEGLVAQHLRAWIDYKKNDAKLYFFRTRAGSEIDFILYGPEIFQAIEVKNSANVRNEDLRHLLTFKKDYPECKPLLIYRGAEKLNISGIDIYPCEKFLSSLVMFP